MVGVLHYLTVVTMMNVMKKTVFKQETDISKAFAKPKMSHFTGYAINMLKTLSECSQPIDHCKVESGSALMLVNFSNALSY